MSYINSDELIPIEQHFRVSAGPGAGKTYWIVQHIKNVLHNSKRLDKTRKIACITYTNVGVETILERLGTNSDQVEVSTIHSFLYKNIVKPYASFLIEDYGLNVSEMDGHDDLVVNFKKVVKWIENHRYAEKLKHPYTIKQLTRLEDNKSAFIRWLSSLSYKFDECNNLIVSTDRKKAYYIVKKNEKVTRRYLNKLCLDVLELDLLGYKKLYWQDGIIDHDDVLFFSYQIIKKYPFILTVLQAKFPYFFVDEFQDTNPIQVAILKLIGQKETIVGIIGDEAQSIYGFQGAEPKQFHSFVLPNIVDYEMADNRRSTNQIIGVLNRVRVDINQNKFKALKHICILLKRCDDFKDKSLLYFHSIVKNEIKSDISNLARGVGKTFYEGHSYQQLALCVKIPDDFSRHRTIHKAKGYEFNNVLVIFKDENNLELFLNPNLNDKEEQRIDYVAISRARERLFINTPSLSEDNLSKLEGMFKIIKI